MRGLAHAWVLIHILPFGGAYGCMSFEDVPPNVEPMTESTSRTKDIGGNPVDPMSSLAGSEGTVGRWARLVERAHDRADAATTDSEKLHVAKLIANLAQSPLPGHTDSIVLAQELAARGSRLYVELQQLDLAAQLISAGLELSKVPSVARAQLMIARADTERARGNEEGERTALLEAISINQQLFETELESP